MSEINFTKRCRRCDLYLPASDFYPNARNKDGLTSYCRACSRAASEASRQKHLEKNLARYRERYVRDRERLIQKAAEYRTTNKDQLLQRSADYRRRMAEYLVGVALPTSATCSACGAVKSIEDFYKAKDRPSGRQSQCKACRLKVTRAWAKANPSTKRRTPEQEKEKVRRQRQTNPGRLAVLSVRGKLRHRQACPAWANREAMARIYNEAIRRRADGEDVHVDHMIPLNSDLVCGLHVEFNLQIMSRADNIKKGADFSGVVPVAAEDLEWQITYGDLVYQTTQPPIDINSEP